MEKAPMKPENFVKKIFMSKEAYQEAIQVLRNNGSKCNKYPRTKKAVPLVQLFSLCFYNWY